MDSVKRILAKHAFTLAGKSLWVFLRVKAHLELIKVSCLVAACAKPGQSFLS